MVEIVIDQTRLRAYEIEFKNKLSQGNYDLDGLLQKYEKEQDRSGDNIKRSILKSFTIQKAIDKAIDQHAPQLEPYGKVFSLDVASSIGLEEMVDGRNQLQKGIATQVFEQKPINFEETIPDPVNQVLRSYFTAINESLRYGVDLADTTLEFWHLIKNTTEKLQKNKKYLELDAFLKQNPIVLDKYRFEGINEQLKPRNANGKEKLTWEKIGGYEDQKLEFLRLGHRIKNLQIAKTYLERSIPRGKLLFGPSGTGKTTIAQTFAENSGLPYELVKAASVGSPYVNESAGKWQNIFDKVGTYVLEGISPGAFLIVDELESISPDRDSSGSKEDNKVTRVFIDNMDGPHHIPGVMVIGTTNKAYMIDSALLSRFSTMEVGFPDKEQRELVYRSIIDRSTEYAKKCVFLESVFADKIDYAKISEASENFTGRNILDAINSNLEENLDRFLINKTPAPPITTESLLKHIEAYKEQNQFKIDKNVSDYKKSIDYLSKVAN